MKTVVGTTLAAILALTSVAHAETHREGNCIVTTDPVHHNVQKQCPGPDDGSDATAPGLAGVPDEWAQPPQQQFAQPSFGGGLRSLVGRWTYTYTEGGNIPAEAVIAFDQNGHYQQWRRFPQTPQLGSQIVEVWGSYTVNGNVLTTTPAGIQIVNGPDPHQICNVQTRQCKPLDLPQPDSAQLTQIDENTVRTPDGGTARRVQ